MTDIKHLISPFALGLPHMPHMPHTMPRPMCNCDDSDEENDFGMAPECAFICDKFTKAPSNRTTKKRRSQTRAKKTRRK